MDQPNVPTSSAPPTPPSNHSSYKHADTAKKPENRQEKRRKWQARKIEERRQKKKGKKATDTAEQDSPLSVSSVGSETHDAAPGNQTDRSWTKGPKRPWIDRTTSQEKKIRKLKLCARCLLRTIPPHSPSSSDAPCKDQPDAVFDMGKISKIEKGLAVHRDGSGRMGGGADKRCGQNSRRMVASPAASVLCWPLQVWPPPFVGFSTPMYPPAAHGVLQAAPPPPPVSSMEEVCIVRSPDFILSRMAKSKENLARREIDVMGTDRPIPEIPSKCVEDEDGLGLSHAPLQRAGVMPDPGSSESALAIPATNPGWDDETMVSGPTPDTTETVLTNEKQCRSKSSLAKG
ncbi:hypothetical protein ACEQ8H_002637 [Pleosporales sp. CAS-2024a]